ncbi:hypothetical protein, partial [Nonomuraea zeae]|uniref:hypothetical protein n=1 Tax=Nonomuraea zeae TaxID=1642303 RepID=UPI00197CC4C6
LTADNPTELADHLTLVFEGLHASGQSLGPQGPAKHARTLVEKLLTTTTPQPNTSRNAGQAGEAS